VALNPALSIFSKVYNTKEKQYMPTKPSLNKQERLEAIKAIRLLSAEELAAYLSVSRTAIYRYIAQGMPHFRPPVDDPYSKRTAYRFDLEQVKEWLRPRE